MCIRDRLNYGDSEPSFIIKISLYTFIVKHYFLSNYVLQRQIFTRVVRTKYELHDFYMLFGRYEPFPCLLIRSFPCPVISRWNCKFKLRFPNIRIFIIFLLKEILFYEEEGE